MKKIQAGLCLLLLLLGISVFADLTPNNRRLQSFTTTSTRTSAVKQSCDGLSRSALTSAESKKTSQISNFLRGYFGLDGSKIIRSAIQGDNDGMIAEINRNNAPVVLLILPFAIGACILVLFAPVLLICCCFRPWCCRSIRFWQKDESDWTWKETKLPAVLGGILALGCLAACCAGFKFMPDLKKAYDNTVCARAIVFDDLINGNVSASGKYFIGLQKFQNQIPNFLENFSAINQSFTDVTSTSGTMKLAQQQLGEAITQLTNIPTGTGKPFNLVYPTPINAEKPTKTIKSLFPTTLGSVNQPSSLIGVTYNQIVASKKALDKVSQISDFYMDIAGPSTHEIGKVQTEIQESIVQIFSLDEKLQAGIKSIQKGPYWLTVGAYVTFSLVLFFAAMACIANVCVSWKQNIRCRFLGYVALAALFLLGLLSFALTITSSVGVPASLFFCDYVDSSLSNAENFKQNFAGIIKKPKVLDAASECVPSSRGTMLNILGGDDLVKSMEALPEAATAMLSIDTKGTSSEILTNFAKLESQIQLTMEAKRMDIADEASIAILDKLSKSFEYKCVANGFHEDSWVPSIAQNPQKIPCKFGLGAIADHTTCAMGDDFQQRASGCVGCMDTFGLFKFTDTKSAVKNALDLRYKGDGCGPFNTQLSNVWNNFYKVKRTAIGPVLDRYKEAKTTVQLGVQTLNRNVSPLFESVIKSLEGSAGIYIDPKGGIGKGLNCNLIGQDMQVLSNNACNIFLPNLYVLLIIFGSLSFALSLSLCCLTCAVVRHFDQYMKNTKNCPVRSDSDDSGPKKVSRANKATSRTVAASSREILANQDAPGKDISASKANTEQEKGLGPRQVQQGAHGRIRYKKRNA